MESQGQFWVLVIGGECTSGQTSTDDENSQLGKAISEMIGGLPKPFAKAKYCQ